MILKKRTLFAPLKRGTFSKKHFCSLLLGAFLLSGCASGLPLTNSKVEENWQFNGKIAIAYPNKNCNTENCLPRSDQGKIVWKQEIANYHITLSDPFGRTLIQLEGDDKNLRAQSPGQAAFDTSPKAFVALMVAESDQQTALEELTPDLLRHWVTGRPAPDFTTKAISDTRFEQQGFEISSTQWRQTDVGQMPSLITIEKGEVKLRLVIRDWKK